VSGESPMDVTCRHCEAKPGTPCTTRQIRDDQEWVRILSFFHSARWRDFNQARNKRAILAEWNRQHGGKTA
jgi:hypothetical protein